MIIKYVFILIIILTVVTNGQNNPIVSLTTGNYWIYEVLNRQGNGSHSSQLYVNKIIGDTVINLKYCKKVEVVSYSGTKKSISYKYWYSDDIVFSTYNGSTFSNYYDSRITRDTTIYYPYVPTRGFYTSSIGIGSEYVFDGNYKTQVYGSSSDRSKSSIVYSMKYGMLRSSGSSWDGTYFSENTSLLCAKIDNTFYGKIAPFMISDYSINNKILEINYELVNNNQQFNKIILYKYNSTKYNYEKYDSVTTPIPQLRKMLFAGDYDLRFSHKTSSGLESALSNNITFSVAPDAFILYQNYPNPFNGRTKIPYETIYTTEIELVIVNILGEKIYKKTISNDKQGYYEFDVDLSGFSSGIYLYQISTKFGRVLTNKMILLK